MWFFKEFSEVSTNSLAIFILRPQLWAERRPIAGFLQKTQGIQVIVLTVKEPFPPGPRVPRPLRPMEKMSELECES